MRFGFLLHLQGAWHVAERKLSILQVFMDANLILGRPMLFCVSLQLDPAEQLWSLRLQSSDSSASSMAPGLWPSACLAHWRLGRVPNFGVGRTTSVLQASKADGEK